MNVTTDQVAVERGAPHAILAAILDRTHMWVDRASRCEACDALAADEPHACLRLTDALLGNHEEASSASAGLVEVAVSAFLTGDALAKEVSDWALDKVRKSRAARSSADDAGPTWEEGFPARKPKIAPLASHIAQTDLTYRGAAAFSADRSRRYLLARRWGPGPVATFGMLNPSKAGAREEDATVRRCRGFALRDGFDGFVVVNLYDLVETESAELRRILGNASEASAAASTPANDVFVEAALRRAANAAASGERAPLIVAWGSASGATVRIAEAQVAAGRRLARRAAELGVEVLCLGLAADGQPRHPLRLERGAPLAPWAA